MSIATLRFISSLRFAMSGPTLTATADWAEDDPGEAG
jgi:hypothetical protein